MTLQERIQARNFKTVFINLETKQYQLEAGEGFDEFKFFKVQAEKIGSTAAALYGKITEQKDALFAATVLQGKSTTDEYREWREREGRPLRPDEGLPVFDSTAFTDLVTEKILEKAMIEPTLEELGGFAMLSDLAEVILEAYQFAFGLNQKAVGEALDTPEVAEMFPGDDGKRVGQPRKKVRKTAELVA
jgi:hypothetical protein